MTLPDGSDGARDIKNRWIVPAAVITFLVIFFILVFSGGQCERYEKKMTQMELMRHYMDSVRSKEQLEKLHKNQADERAEQEANAKKATPSDTK